MTNHWQKLGKSYKDNKTGKVKLPFVLFKKSVDKRFYMWYTYIIRKKGDDSNANTQGNFDDNKKSIEKGLP